VPKHDAASKKDEITTLSLATIRQSVLQVLAEVAEIREPARVKVVVASIMQPSAEYAARWQPSC
jgi:hypothetical protein